MLTMTPSWGKPAYTGGAVVNDLMALRACPLCGGVGGMRVLSYVQDYEFPGTGLHVPQRDVQCRHCWAVYKNPIYTDTGYQRLFQLAGVSMGTENVARAQEQADWVQQHLSQAANLRMLDVGCGDGRFLSHFPTALSRVGVECDADTVAAGRDRYGASIHFEEMTLDSYAPTATHSFDVITMFHVLEHVNDPVGTLRTLRLLAAENALLVIEVPVLNLFTNGDIGGFMTPQHLTHFSVRSASSAILQGGWCVMGNAPCQGYNGVRFVAAPSDVAVPLVEWTALDSARASRLVAQVSMSAANVTTRLMTRIASMGARRAVVWGAGFHLETLYHQTPLFRALDSFVIVDGDDSKHGRTWRGLSIGSPDSLQDMEWDETALIVSSYASQPGIVDAALALGIPQERIVTLYEQVDAY